MQVSEGSPDEDYSAQVEQSAAAPEEVVAAAMVDSPGVDLSSAVRLELVAAVFAEERVESLFSCAPGEMDSAALPVDKMVEKQGYVPAGDLFAGVPHPQDRLE